jgi:ubiquinone/menaquinone biosynthesis C-methylase UbiE
MMLGSVFRRLSIRVGASRRQGLVLVFLSVVLAGCARPAAYGELDKELNRRQPPDKVLAAARVRPGQVVGEVGAGWGRYTVEIARRVGPSGRVYANDIDRDSLEYLRQRCKKAKLANVEVVIGREKDPRFPHGALDLAFMINTYHHLDDPVALLRNLRPALKPGATLVIVEKDPDRSPANPHHGTARKTVVRQAGEAGFELVRVETFLELDNIYIFRLAPAR